MANTSVLVVTGESDFGAKLFEDNYSPEQIYQEMREAGVTKKVILHEEEFNDEKIHINLYEFGEVDSRFIELIEANFIDYDFAKHKNFFVVAKPELG